MAPKNNQTINSMTVSDLRKIIHEEFEKAFKTQVDERLSKMEESIKQIGNLRATVDSLEVALSNTSQRFDDLEKVTLPALASHIERITEAAIFQSLDLDVHRRKWNITLQGLPGLTGESEDITRESCVKFAKENLQLADAKNADFSACHRLKQEPNAAIIMRFRDLRDRNRWLDGAKKLKGKGLKVSIAPDLPPTLRALKTELLDIRKELPADKKSRSYIRYMAQWPYVELSVPDQPRIPPKTTKKAVLEKVLGTKSLFILN